MVWSNPEHEHYDVASQEDVVRVRRAVQGYAERLGFSVLDQTRLMTAASELARNALVHAGGGEATVEAVTRGLQRGLQLTLQDHGPGIPDLELALRDGYSSGDGLGLGLGGAQRLAHEFEVEPLMPSGLRVVVRRWRGQP
ncbi:anti-sigma regulatory factor [Deinococcus sonorensis]|uniref:Anti-sigma regulatory factor n=2 Tax=Deinococcus sonorensis TaxID=309891 RepID=A0AAU7U4S1_9DEIO